jgi:hypothetical protein
MQPEVPTAYPKPHRHSLLSKTPTPTNQTILPPNQKPEQKRRLIKRQERTQGWAAPRKRGALRGSRGRCGRGGDRWRCRPRRATAASPLRPSPANPRRRFSPVSPAASFRAIAAVGVAGCFWKLGALRDSMVGAMSPRVGVGEWGQTARDDAWIGRRAWTVSWGLRPQPNGAVPRAFSLSVPSSMTRGKCRVHRAVATGPELRVNRYYQSKFKIWIWIQNRKHLTKFSKILQGV